MTLQDNERKENIKFIYTIMLVIILSVIIRENVFSLASVYGTSMQPTLETNDIVIVNKIVRTNKITYGDVINVKGESDGKILIKRVIGLPGDEIKIVEGTVYVNGLPEDTEYLGDSVHTSTYSQNEWLVEEGQLFVLGDNRANSLDSRDFGCISFGQVDGEALYLAFPLSRLSKI